MSARSEWMASGLLTNGVAPLTGDFHLSSTSCCGNLWPWAN